MMRCTIPAFRLGPVVVGKPKLTAHRRLEALKRRNRGEAVREIGRSYNVSHSTIRG